MNILNVPGKRKRPGFTLAEVLISVAISAFVMAGVYVIFNSVLNTKIGLEAADDDLIVSQALERMISRDIRMMTSGSVLNPPYLRDANDRLMAIISQNSLTFNKSIPVDVIYYMDNGTLFRTERHQDMNYMMTMPMIHNVTDWYVESFDGSEYKEDYVNSRYIFRFTFMMNNRQVQFVTGRMVDSTFE